MAYAILVWIFFFHVLHLLFSTVVAKSALLIYNPSRDLQKVPEKRSLQSLRDLRADCLPLCQWFTTKFQPIPVSVLIEADASLMHKVWTKQVLVQDVTAAADKVRRAL